MPMFLSIAFVVIISGYASAQVINGESTADSAYAPRPPARWHSPEFEGEVPGGHPQGDGADVRDRGVRSEKPRD